MSDTLQWFKSIYNSPTGGERIEVAFNRRKSSYSDSGGGQCVEGAACPTVVPVRDSKDPGHGTFAVGSSAWAAFPTGAVRS
ncbi:DUF397 domain-containing protein [Streptomyces sp. MUM 203J]|uniref:DUF397 domain-containing protein n=1 Tax=Streptomyces sp. MUM 203J TaxID=2791990 RepID=UPI001F032ECD|nr:DUF397 domain-containing protein [Streptomyces sp. MUM 203J]MCH0539806.1 DUF397 domain-containing protein [Streptomyces sp. MUM 203J]